MYCIRNQKQMTASQPSEVIVEWEFCDKGKRNSKMKWNNNRTKSFYQFLFFASRTIQLKSIQPKHQHEKQISRFGSTLKVYQAIKPFIKNQKYYIYCHPSNCMQNAVWCGSPVTDLTQSEPVIEHKEPMDLLWPIHSHRKMV